MVRFSDDWVVDRTMFEYVNGGSCACCGFTHLFNPDGLQGLINACTDLETDAANAELTAAERSPWPPQMRDQIWADRVRLRTKMKLEMKAYNTFFEQNDRHEVEHWLLDVLGAQGLRVLFQMPRSEISESLNGQYNIHSAYAVVMCAVAEQVANFRATKYDTDGRGPEEISFETLLSFDRRGGFIIPITDEDFEDSVRIFLDFMFTLGGPKLLARGGKTSKDSGDEQGDDEGDADDVEQEKQPSQKRGPSFRSDRRMIRLLIARYWSRRIMDKYSNETNGKSGSSEEPL